MATTTIVKDINDGILAQAATVLGADYKELPYVYDVVKNNFRTSKSRYGARPLSTVEIDGVVKATTHIQTFEVVLTEGYSQTSISDAKLQEKAFIAYEKMYDIYQALAQNNAGVPGSVLLVQNLSILEPEVLEEDKVVVLRGQFDVLYRIEL